MAVTSWKVSTASQPGLWASPTQVHLVDRDWWTWTKGQGLEDRDWWTDTSGQGLVVRD